MTTGKTIAWTRWAFVGKVMSLLLNMLRYLNPQVINTYKGLAIPYKKVLTIIYFVMAKDTL